MYAPEPAFVEFIEPEYFRLQDPLWEQEEPAVLELRMLKEDLERAGAAGEPLKLRRFVLDLYRQEIVYLRNALRMAEMYDLSESAPEYFSLDVPQPRGQSADRPLITAKAGDD